MNLIELRIAIENTTSKDSILQWIWRNDPITRTMSRNTEVIPWPVHKSWYEQLRNNPKRTIIMVYRENKPIGVVRFDHITDTTAEININMNPEKRNQGLGSKTLTIACKYGFEELKIENIYAEIRQNNKPSLRIFEKVGFKFQGFHKELLLYILNKTTIAIFTLTTLFSVELVID